MARLLICAARYPADIRSGEFLRTHNFCKELAKRHESYLVFFDEPDSEINPGQSLGVEAWQSLPPAPRHGRSRRRLLRFSNARLLELSVPDYLAKSREAIRALCERWQIDVILCLSPGIAEIVVDMDVPKILEYCDSGTLTLQRVLANRGSSLSVLDRAKVHLRKARQGSLERTFLRTFDHATTISSADKQSFLDVAQISPDKVTVVPNGVDEKALAAGDLKCERQRSVVFWGNLDFPPNWTAVEYFFDSIYRPYLSNAKVEWHIFGRGASERLEQIARHENVYLHGFVDDLFSEVAKQGIMINSMVEGSGLKNKVLEAFACRVPVVSTSLGIEAIDAVPDRHYVKADDPREFAAAIIRLLDDQVRASSIAEEARRLAETGFRWTVIGDQLGQLVDRIACRDAARHARTA